VRFAAQKNVGVETKRGRRSAETDPFLLLTPPRCLASRELVRKGGQDNLLFLFLFSKKELTLVKSKIR
jgi:hypothetical protein